MTQTRRLLVSVALLATTLQRGQPAVIFVLQVSMTRTLMLLLHVQAVRWVSTRQQGRRLALTVRLDMRTGTVTQRRSALHATSASTLQPGQPLA